MLMLTRVSRWSPRSSSSSSNPGGRSAVRVVARRRRTPLFRRRGFATSVLTDSFLDRPHREIVGDRALRQLLLKGAIGCREESPCMTHREPALVHQLLDRRWELEQPERVGDRRAALADLRGDRLVGKPEVLDQLLVRRRLLERVEVVAVKVFDQRVLERGGVVGLAHQRRDPVEPHAPGGTPPSLARDQLVAVLDRPDEHRLEHADLTDRVGQGAEGLLVEVAARLETVRPDRLDGQLLEPVPTSAVGVDLDTGGDECPEALTQSAASRHGSPLSPASGTPSHHETSDRTR